MKLYACLGTNDMTRAAAFYDAVFAAIGIGRLPGGDADWTGWGDGGDDRDGTGFWICTPYDGAPATPGNGTMIGLPVASAAAVRAAHTAGLSAGGTDEGPPGTRERYEPDFYVAYLRDPDGNKLSIFHSHYDPSEDA